MAEADAIETSTPNSVPIRGIRQPSARTVAVQLAAADAPRGMRVTTHVEQGIQRDGRPDRRKIAAMTEDRRIQILSVDDHPVVREGIAAVIAAQPDMNLVSQAPDGRSAIDEYRRHRPDVTLMDVRLPDMNGIDAVIAIRSEFADARIVMLSLFQGDVEIRRALNAGARGFLLKSMLPRDMMASIRQVHAGRSACRQTSRRTSWNFGEDVLTPREVQVLQLVAAGKANRDIGDALAISEDTVKTHVKHVMGKLGANDRTDAVVIGLRRGIIQL